MSEPTPIHRAAPAGVRRVITGHDDRGLSVIQEDRVSPFVLATAGGKGPVVFDLWKTMSTPADNDGGEPCSSDITLAPPEGGSVLRVVEFPPDASYMAGWNPTETFDALGHPLEPGAANQRTPGMHRTRSVDYAIVLNGEIWAVMDREERLLKAGDVLVQRGTNHAWSNRTSFAVRIAFVLIDAKETRAADGR